MDHRIVLSPLANWRDARGEGTKAQIKNFLKIDLDKVATRDVYTIHADITADEAAKIASLLVNPVLQSWKAGDAASANDKAPATPDFIVVIGFKPGVTDNVGRSAKAAVSDILGRKLGENEHVFSSVEYLLYGKALTADDAKTIGVKLLGNELIQSVTVLPGSDLNNIPLNLPLIEGVTSGTVHEYNLEVSDEGLMEISRKGTLALTLDEMKSIQNYFRNAVGRKDVGLNQNPTDVELEVLAQTWSEHCKHKIFSAIIDYENAETGEKETIDSCYKSFVKKSTNEIAEEVDWLVSVFHDNAGVIAFNDKVDLVYKVETHNSPSALDPYGGAMTGIVGVNRDPMGDRKSVV